MAELRHWLTEVEPTAVRRSDMLLRVFFLTLVDNDQADAYLKKRATVSADYHDALQKIADDIPNPGGPLAVSGRIALEWGLRYTRMQREWAEWAVEELANTREPSD
jgi:PadR family transcriptional regulator AphA